LTWPNLNWPFWPLNCAWRPRRTGTEICLSLSNGRAWLLERPLGEPAGLRSRQGGSPPRAPRSPDDWPPAV